MLKSGEKISEDIQKTPVIAHKDVIVCGGGPAGVAAALSAARGGASTLLIEVEGCLGGVWTAGMLSWIIDHANKGGVMGEILERLQQEEGRAKNLNGSLTNGYSIEAMKWVLESMCLEEGVEVRLHSRVVGGFFAKEDRQLTHVLVESASGREAFAGTLFIDCTGNGDLAARSGCGFDLGHPENGLTQPMSLMALLTGLDRKAIHPYLSGVGNKDPEPKMRIKGDLERAGLEPSYSRPTLFSLPDDLYAFMANHQYGGNSLNAKALSNHTLEARQEINKLIKGLRSLGSPWSKVTLVATAAHIGIREGRRIHGHYTVDKNDIERGARFEDAVCRATFCVDIHALSKRDGGGYGSGGVSSKPYDIPFRALVAKDVEGLLMAGRCISGDFFAHASYRVTGNAVAMGEAAGKAAARCVYESRMPHELFTKRPEALVST